MKCSMKKMRDLALAHELHKFYENHHGANEIVEVEPEKKSNKLFVWLVVSGIVAAGAAVLYFVSRNKEDFYGDDFWDEDEALFDDEDEYDEELEEELEEALMEALEEAIAEEEANK